MKAKNIQHLAKSVQLNIDSQQAEKMAQEHEQIIVQLKELLAVDRIVVEADNQLINGLSLADDQTVDWLDGQSLASTHLVGDQVEQVEGWLVVPNVRSKN